VGGGLDEALTIELEDPMSLGRHEEATILLRRHPLAGCLGETLEDGRVGLLEDQGSAPLVSRRVEGV
jgi:hypothetical protein